MLFRSETVAYSEAPVRNSAPPDSSSLSEVRSETLQPNMEVAVEVDAPRFFRLFVSRLSGKPVEF